MVMALIRVQIKRTMPREKKLRNCRFRMSLNQKIPRIYARMRQIKKEMIKTVITPIIKTYPGKIEAQIIIA